MPAKFSHRSIAMAVVTGVLVVVVTSILLFAIMMAMSPLDGDSMIVEPENVTVEEIRHEDAPQILDGVVPTTVPQYYEEENLPVDENETGPADGRHIVPLQNIEEPVPGE